MQEQMHSLVGINTTAPTASIEVAVASGSAGTSLRVTSSGDVVIRLGRAGIGNRHWAPCNAVSWVAKWEWQSC